MQKVKTRSILIGDTNCDLKNHKDGCTKSIKSIYSEFQFEQQINEYTRVAALEKDGAPGGWGGGT